jgi:ribosomal protein L1
MSKLTETVTIEQEVTGVIADLVHFVRYVGRVLGQRGLNPSAATDEQLISLARDFWDTQHGED